MKQEDFIVGKWYKSQLNNYFKFKEFKNNCFYSSEGIYNKRWERRWGGMIGKRGVFEIDILEIQEYLPDNHPDKLIINTKEEDDYSYLISILEKYNIT